MARSKNVHCEFPRKGKQHNRPEEAGVNSAPPSAKLGLLIKVSGQLAYRLPPGHRKPGVNCTSPASALPSTPKLDPWLINGSSGPLSVSAELGQSAPSSPGLPPTGTGPPEAVASEPESAIGLRQPWWADLRSSSPMSLMLSSPTFPRGPSPNPPEALDSHTFSHTTQMCEDKSRRAPLHVPTCPEDSDSPLSDLESVSSQPSMIRSRPRETEVAQTEVGQTEVGHMKSVKPQRRKKRAYHKRQETATDEERREQKRKKGHRRQERLHQRDTNEPGF